MPDKPIHASGYSPEELHLVRRACLHISTYVGSYMDELVVVGGLVPSLIIPQDQKTEGFEPHVGSRDVDLGFAVALLGSKRYQEIAECLRKAGFSPDTNEKGNPTKHRWKYDLEDARKVTVDFLIPQVAKTRSAGRIMNLESDFAAVVTPALPLAFVDRLKIPLEGETLRKGEQVKREIPVAGPGAFVVLKALAFRGRGENKDAYDLYYVLRNYGSGVKDVCQRFSLVKKDEQAVQALSILKEDFDNPRKAGPRRVAEFLRQRPDDDLQAEVAGFAREFIAGIS